MTGRPADPLALLTGYVNELFVDGDADATWTAEYAEAKAALAAVERLVEAARAKRASDHNIPLLLDDLTYEDWANENRALGAELDAALAVFPGQETKDSE